MMHSACDLHRYTFMGRNSRGVAYLCGSQLSGERRHFRNFMVYNPGSTRVRSELKKPLKSVKTPLRSHANRSKLRENVR